MPLNEISSGAVGKSGWLTSALVARACVGGTLERLAAPSGARGAATIRRGTEFADVGGASGPLSAHTGLRPCYPSRLMKAIPELRLTAPELGGGPSPTFALRRGAVLEQRKACGPGIADSEGRSAASGGR